MGPLDELTQAMDQLIRDAPELRRELHQDLAELLQAEVDGAMSAAFQTDRGRVRRWQRKHVGSRGGYAAIRPMGRREGGTSGRDGEAAVTNYLEGGHKIRVPGGSSKHYRPGRIQVSYVNGYHFYQSARSAVEPKAIQMAEQFCSNLIDRLEGSS